MSRFIWVVFETGSHYTYSLGWVQTHNPPTSASLVLGLQVCDTISGISQEFSSYFFFFLWDWGFNSGLHAYKAGAPTT
jgi:hypothetical protein